jgi:PPOX class probable F420-dependent enzyme
MPTATGGLTQIPEQHRAILQTKGFAHVATIGPHGEPQSTPVWFDTDGERLLISLTKTRQKYKNLQADRRVAVSITDPENPYHSLELRGTASFTDDPDKAFINRLSNKYLGKDYPWNQPGDERVVVAIEPHHSTFMG